MVTDVSWFAEENDVTTSQQWSRRSTEVVTSSVDIIGAVFQLDIIFRISLFESMAFLKQLRSALF